MKKGGPLRRSPFKARRTAIRKRNGRKVMKQRAKAFGDKREFIMQQPCAVANQDCKYAWYQKPTPGWWSDPAHLSHSQGAGGTMGDLVPLCHHHHLEQHRGIETFEAKHNVDRFKLAAHYEALYAGMLNADDEY